MNDTFNVRVPQQSVMRHITMHVTVTGVQVWKLRQALGIQLLKLSARVMGCNIAVDMEEDD